MHNYIARLGAWLILLLGVLTAIILVIIAIAVLIAYPEANINKKIVVSIGLIILAIIVFIATLGFYETGIEVEKLEQEVENLTKKGGR
jgi:chromate transport protein ChrA